MRVNALAVDQLTLHYGKENQVTLVITRSCVAQMSEPRYALFKVVLLGESAVGKLSIVHRFVKNNFDDLRELTIGAAFLTQTLELPDKNATVKFEIWDTAGQERYKSLAPMYYRNAHAALCVYDVTSAESFRRAEEWIEELRKQAPEHIVIALVGNKADLEEQRAVPESAVTSLTARVGANFVILAKECSAKTGEGIVEVFREVAERLPLDRGEPRPAARVELNRAPAQQGCC